jgi:hypothetical protein
LAIVSSAPQNFKKRDAIRLTWGNDISHIDNSGRGLRGRLIFQVGTFPNDERMNNLVHNESSQVSAVVHGTVPPSQIGFFFGKIGKKFGKIGKIIGKNLGKFGKKIRKN